MGAKWNHEYDTTAPGAVDHHYSSKSFPGIEKIERVSYDQTVKTAVFFRRGTGGYFRTIREAMALENRV